MSETSLTPPASFPGSLPEYESHLLTALAFFLGRDATSQAKACLCMYLRQSEPRIMAQLRYYAHKASRLTGQSLSEYDLLDWIERSPQEVAALLADSPGVHTDQPPDVFD